MKNVVAAIILVAVHGALHGQSVEEEFANWMKQTDFSYYFEVSEYDQLNKKLTLQVKPTFDTEEGVQIVYEFWDSFELYGDSVNVKLSELLLSQLHRVTNGTYYALTIRIVSPFNGHTFLEIKPVPGLFSDYDLPEVETSKYYTKSRDIGSVPITSLRGFGPAGVIPLNIAIEKAKVIMRSSLLEYAESKFDVAREQIQIQKIGSFKEAYVIEKKNMLTDNYNERIEVEVDYHIITEIETQVNYQVKALYARGILQPGEYEQVDEHALVHLIDLFQSFPEMVLSNARKK